MRSLVHTLAILFTLSQWTAAADHELPRTITVSGQGKAAAPPDLATVNTGVSTTAPTAKEALSKNTDAMRRVMKVLKERNIADKDIQTSNFSVFPEYRRQPRGSNAPPEIAGYRVTNQVQVRVRNLARLGEVLDALVQGGSNQVSGISFSIADPRSVMNDARKAAIDDARGRAELYAAATGTRIAKVISISEQAIRQPRPEMMRARAMMADAESVPIATGEQQVSASINVMYQLID